MNECGSFIPVSKLILFLTFELKVSNVSPNPETCPKFEKVWAAKFAEGALHKIVTVHLSRNTHHISVRSTCYGLGLLSSLFECTMCVFVFFIWAVCVFVFFVLLHWSSRSNFITTCIFVVDVHILFCIVCMIVVVVVCMLNNQTASV